MFYKYTPISLRPIFYLFVTALLVGAQKNAWLKRYVLRGEKALTLVGQIDISTDIETLFAITKTNSTPMRIEMVRHANANTDDTLKGRY